MLRDLAGKAVFLLDVDRTLIDSDLLRRRIADKAEKRIPVGFSGKAFWEYYEIAKRRLGFVDLPQICESIAAAFDLPEKSGEVLIDAFMGISFADCTYDGARELVEAIQQSDKMHAIFFTEGFEPFQRAKLAGSGLLDLVSPDQVEIYGQSKKDALPESFSRLRQGGVGEIIMIDDQLKVLEKAHEADPLVRCFLMNHAGRNKLDGRHQFIEQQFFSLPQAANHFGLAIRPVEVEGQFFEGVMAKR